MDGAFMDREATNLLVEKFGQKYSDILGINLKTKHDGEIFKWFLASVLFGAPINETSVIRTYKCFESHKVLTPEKILETGWDGLVKILDEGGYARYDFKTSDKLLEVMGNLLTKYKGSLNLIHEQASDSHDLEKRLKDLGKGVGDVTVSIFLRELRDLWKKADSKPTSLVVLAAKNLGIVKEESPEKALVELKEFWRKNEVVGKTFVNFETALLRLGKNFCRKKKCRQCVLKQYCLVIASG
jgi:endonuclease III